MKVDFVFDSGTADPTSDFVVSLEGNPSQTFSNTFQISFSPGEQSKVVNILASPDSFIETLENYNFKLNNFFSYKNLLSVQIK